MIDQDVGPDHAFHRVEHLGMAHQFIHPGEQQVRLGPHEIGESAEGVTLLAFETLEATAEMAHLVWRQAIHREEEAVTLILRDLRG